MFHTQGSLVRYQHRAGPYASNACPRWPRALSRIMSEHKMTLTWKRGDAPFDYQKYPRNHTWKFAGGQEMTASAAPAYLGDPKNVNPEDDYVDEAVGHMEKNAEGKMAITKVTLTPKITFSGDKKPSADELDKMHHAAHDNCFIANSVKTEVTVEK